MKITRLLALFLAVLMLLSMFAACGEAAAEPTQAPAETKAPATQTPVTSQPDEPVELYPLTEEPVSYTLWTPYSATSAQYLDSILDIPVFDKLEEKLNVFIEPTCVSSSAAKEAFNIMVGAGEEYDLINWVGNYYTGGLVGAMDDGVTIDMYDYVYENMPNFVARAQELGVEKDLVSDDGRMGAFYTLQSPAGSSMKTIGVAIRKDWLDEFNMDIPTTYAEFYEAAKVINTEYGAVMFLNYIGHTNYNEISAGYNLCLAESGGRQPFTVREGKISLDWQRDEFREYLTMMNKWYEEGLIWEEFATGKHSWITFNDNAVSDLVSGKIFAAQMELGDVTIFSNQATEDQVGMELASMPMLKKDADTEIHVITQALTHGAAWCVTPYCENIELLCRYVDYLYTDEGSELCTFGVEGYSYTKENGEYKFTELITNDPNGRAVKNLFDIYMFDGSTCPFYLNTERNLLAYNESALEYGKVWASGHDNTYLLPTSLSATTEENEKFNAVWNEIDTFVVEHMPKFIMGELDVEDDAVWSDFQKTMKELGADDTVAVKQAMYDRYLKR